MTRDLGDTELGKLVLQVFELLLKLLFTLLAKLVCLNFCYTKTMPNSETPAFWFLAGLLFCLVVFFFCLRLVLLVQCVDSGEVLSAVMSACCVVCRVLPVVLPCCVCSVSTLLVKCLAVCWCTDWYCSLLIILSAVSVSCCLMWRLVFRSVPMCFLWA